MFQHSNHHLKLHGCDTIRQCFCTTILTTAHSNPGEGTCLELKFLGNWRELQGLGGKAHGTCCGSSNLESYKIVLQANLGSYGGGGEYFRACSNLHGNEEVNFARSVHFWEFRKAFVFLPFVFVTYTHI